MPREMTFPFSASQKWSDIYDYIRYNAAFCVQLLFPLFILLLLFYSICGIWVLVVFFWIINVNSMYCSFFSSHKSYLQFVDAFSFLWVFTGVQHAPCKYKNFYLAAACVSWLIAINTHHSLGFTLGMIVRSTVQLLPMHWTSLPTEPFAFPGI